MIGYGPDQTDRSLGMNQTKQTDDWERARANRPVTGYGPDETDRILDMGQSEQTRDWVSARRSRPMFGYWPDRTDRRLDKDKTKQTDVWVLTRANIPNSGMGQTEQTQYPYGLDGRRDQKFFQTKNSVTPEPPVGDPGPSGQYLSTN